MTGSRRAPVNDGNQWTTPASSTHGPDLANRQMRTARAAVVLIVLILTGCGLPQATEPTPAVTAVAPTGPSVPAQSSAASPAPTASPEPSTQTTAGPASPPPPRTAKPRDPEGVVISTAGSQFGTILYADAGQAIYIFDAERDARPQCYSDCADAWPPVLTKGTPQRARAVRKDLLGTTRRRDGALQVTYAGHPLYFYANEGKYEVLCHNVDEFGGTWLAVKPSGQPAPI